MNVRQRAFRYWAVDEALAATLGGQEPLERIELWVSIEAGFRETQRGNAIVRRGSDRRP
jgi:hypothetical protein